MSIKEKGYTAISTALGLQRITPRAIISNGKMLEH